MLGLMTTVRQFAEKVLFGESLADKLAPPPAAGLEDVARGPAMEAPWMPGRPQALRLQKDGVRVDFPGAAHLEDERERGRLLHFFANHELLATELMALVLLKFPDAPAEFRAGVLKTLKEEQMHTKLYLRRMEACGVDFGELPVNGFFWNLVAPMRTPLDYVTRLSLTFEQANLDYARGYAEVFSEAGDHETAGILDRIYHDEINHVHYGLSWFRRWREGRSDWKSFCSLMTAPLSAARAKGAFEFNEEGRRAAGLDEEFIRELKVFSRSRGRVPDVFWFNPDAEEEWAGKASKGATGAITRDLEMVMVALAKADDVAVLRELPSLEHRECLQSAGLELPEMIPWNEQTTLKDRLLGEARPWAVTPSSAARAEALGLEPPVIEPSRFSKIEHARFLERLLEASDWDLLMDRQDIGRQVGSVEEVRDLLGEGPARTWLVKAPFSTAGRDRMRLAPGFGGKDEARLQAMFERTPELLVEPWLERVLDFSIHYDVRDQAVRRKGIVVMENTDRGQFRSARATRRPFEGLADGDRRMIFEGGSGRGRWIDWLEQAFEPALADWLGDHRGPVGVDVFLFREASGELRLRPVVEINPRFTMGRVAIELERQLGAGASLEIRTMSEEAPAGSTALTVVGSGTRLVAYAVSGNR